MPEAQQFGIERYKYILSEMGRLNQDIHEYLRMFQVALASIGGVIAGCLAAAKNGTLPTIVVGEAISGFTCIITVLGGFIVVVSVAGMFSWLDYRREEVKLLKHFDLDFRDAPRFGNFLRWRETYAVLFVTLSVILLNVWVFVYLRPGLM